MTTLQTLDTATGSVRYCPLSSVADADRMARLPYTIRVFLENVLRHQGRGAEAHHLDALVNWPQGDPIEIPFRPARVLLQDLTGVPCVADLAAMRDAVARLGGDPAKVSPRIRGDLVIDHSVVVDEFGVPEAFQRNVAIEVRRNRERFAFLRWAQDAFDRFTVVPPGAGIVHQVNLEYFASAVMTSDDGVAYPDTLVGTDSHTTMIGGLGVLGWGVGGIEAEAALLGESLALLTPTVVGMRLHGRLPEGATATDLVLAVTEVLRDHGVVGKFVEFFGDGLDHLSVPDRATISNMSPEYGATEGIFPIDAQTLAYLRGSGRDEAVVDLVERYCRAQGLFRHTGDPDPVFSERLEFDLGTVRPSMAGPRRPQDRVSLPEVRSVFRSSLATLRGGSDDVRRVGVKDDLDVADGSVVIAAITSCTNTSNPSVMVGAGLLARNAVERGLTVSPTVKTSLAPGSPVVMDYLRRAGLVEPLEQLGFYLVGFGCTTCIGNSGDNLAFDELSEAVRTNELAAVSVLSGNRNFEGRIHPLVRFSFLASPPLVVAYALAGTVDIDVSTQPIGTGSDGAPVMLSDIWPSSDEVARTVAASMDSQAYRDRYADIYAGNDAWNSLEVPEGTLYAWDPESTYIKQPPFMATMTLEPAPVADVAGARVLALLGDSVTTDHISPASSIPAASPAGRWLVDHGVSQRDFNLYGARRGNHEVMLRGTFANIRLRNLLVEGVEGGFTRHMPSGEQTTIFEAAERYRADGVPLVVIAGAEYGTGSSRDWAAKGTALLGVRAVIARSYERIHRSNLIQMGVLPLQFAEGQSATTLGLTGEETYDVTGLASIEPAAAVGVVAHRPDGSTVAFDTVARIDTPTELRYFREGGILPAVVRELVRG